MMILPLTQWTLYGEDLPERLLDQDQKPSFTLPGADALSAFADLIGDEEKEQKTSEPSGIPHTAGTLFDEDIAGCVCLKREIDFGEMQGDYAVLAFEHIAGSGSVRLGEEELARFGTDHTLALRNAYDRTGMPCGLCVDVTPWLMRGKPEMLELRFDDAHASGVCGSAFLRVCSHAHLSHVSIQPDANRRTMTLRTRITAHQAGRYVLRAQVIPGEKETAVPEARETDVILSVGDEKNLQISMDVAAPVFAPGKAYAAPAMKIQLFYRQENTRSDGLACDDALLMCGYGAPAPKVWLPVCVQQVHNEADKLIEKIRELGVFAVALDEPAPDGLYRALCHAGIAVIGHVSEEIRPLFTRYPCLTLSDFPPAKDDVSLTAAAWQMTGSVAFPRAIDATLTTREMMDEACGRRLDLEQACVQEALS